MNWLLASKWWIAVDASTIANAFLSVVLLLIWALENFLLGSAAGLAVSRGSHCPTHAPTPVLD